MARPKLPVSAAQFQRRRPWANRGTLIVAASSPGITNRHSKRGWFAGGTNKNVMCYLDDIYIYLRARPPAEPLAQGALQNIKPSPPPRKRLKIAAWGELENTLRRIAFIR